MEELLQSISSEEIAEWAAYYHLDPFGSYRADLQAGIVASTIAQVNAKRGHTFKPSDFMPKFDAQDTPQPMTPQQMQEFLAIRFGRKLNG